MGEIMIFGETKFFVHARRGLAKFALAAMVCLVTPQAALAEEVSAEAKAKAQLT